MPTITDWLMVIITAIYVIATITICWANMKSAKATREQVAEAKRQFEESNRAFVTITFEVIKSGLAVLCIQNHGKRIAYDVKISISDKFLSNIKDEKDKKRLCLLCQSCFTLGIGQFWYVCFGSHLQIQQMSAELLEVNLSYRDDTSSYNETTKIDLRQYFWALLYESPVEEMRKEIIELTRNVESISNALQKI